MHDYPALVLNADYSPISVYPLSVWNFERTLRNVIKGSVTVVETYGTTLRSPTFSYEVPSVVSLNRYVKRPSKIRFTRMNVFLRDKFRCQYCGARKKAQNLTFDHMIPRSHGGKTAWDNIVSCCSSCNAKKGNRLDFKPMTKPRQPTFFDMKAAREQFKTADLHKSWHDYLYWDSELEPN